jgi:adenylyltransferase/sulfurtransferase
MRYQRQILVPEVGTLGQASLQNARVLIVGLGGLGSPASLYLAGAGIGTLGLMDGDEVSLSNLHRQVLFSSDEVGMKKAIAAKAKLSKLNTDILIHAHEQDLNVDNAIEVMAHYDLIIDGTDRFSSKYLINDAALKLHLPWIYASVSQWEGQIALFDPRKTKTPCYRCFRPAPPKIQVQNCAESGVIGPVVGILGVQQALLAIQTFLPQVHEQSAQLRIYNGLKHEWMSLSLPKNPNCPVCSKAPHEIPLKREPETTCDLNASHFMTVKALKLNYEEVLKEFRLIDVREPDEWQTFHLKGAIHWPLSSLNENRFPDLRRDQKILVYCQSGKRSKLAAQALQESGFTAVSELEKGLLEW